MCVHPCVHVHVSMRAYAVIVCVRACVSKEAARHKIGPGARPPDQGPHRHNGNDCQTLAIKRWEASMCPNAAPVTVRLGIAAPAKRHPLHRRRNRGLLSFNVAAGQLAGLTRSAYRSGLPDCIGRFVTSESGVPKSVGDADYD